MPVYEYRCSNCNLRFSVMGNMAEAGEDGTCPNCGSASPRVMSPFSLRIATPFRIMQEEADNPGHFRQRAFAPDCDTPPPGTSREYWDGVDRDGDAELGEKIEKEYAEVAAGHKEPSSKRIKQSMPRMFPNGAPIKGLDSKGRT